MEQMMLLNAASKGYPQHLDPMPLEQAGKQGWNVRSGYLPLPCALLKHDAVEQNLAGIGDVCQSSGLGNTHR